MKDSSMETIGAQSAESKYEALKQYLAELGPTAVAFSAGLDSTFLLYAAKEALGDRVIRGLLEIPDTVLNGDPHSRLPGNVNVSFAGISAEPLLLLLDQKGIQASSGSACTSGALDPSHVLLALGRSGDEARGSLRLTLGEDISDRDVGQIITAVSETVQHLRQFHF